MNSILEIEDPVKPITYEMVEHPWRLGALRGGLYRDDPKRRHDCMWSFPDPKLVKYSVSHALHAAELRADKKQSSEVVTLKAGEENDEEKELTQDDIAETNMVQADFVEGSETQTTELAGLRRRVSRRTVDLQFTEGNNLADIAVTDAGAGLRSAGLEKIRALASIDQVVPESITDAYSNILQTRRDILDN